MAADEDDNAGEDKLSEERRQRERRKPPVTIDLTAEAVKAKAAAFDATSNPDAARESASGTRTADDFASQPPPNNGKAEIRSDRLAAARAFAADENWRRSAMAGIAGGLAAFLLVIILQAVGLLPAPGRSTANQAADGVRAVADASAALERRVTAIEAMTEGLPAMRGEIKAISDRTESLAAGQAGLASKEDLAGTTDAIAALTARLDGLPAPATQSDLADLGNRVGRLEVTAATSGNGDGGASSEVVASLSGQLASAQSGLAAMTERLKAAEDKLAALSTGQTGSGAGAVRAMAVASLRRAAESDLAFPGDVDTMAALGAPAEEIASLRPFAAKGVPSTAALAAEFRSVADAIVAATATSDPDAGFFQRVVASLGSLVSIRPAGPIAGDDPEAIVSRMTAAIAAGDLAGALTEREALPEAGKAASAAWAAAATERITLDELVERVARSFDGFDPVSGRATDVGVAPPT